MPFLGFRALLLALLCFVLVPALLATVIGLNIKEKFFDPEFYISLLEKHNAYEQIKVGFIEAVIEGIKDTGPITPERKANLKTELARAIPTSWFKNQTNWAIRNGLSYIKSETDVLNLTFSLREIKPGITSAMLGVMNVTPAESITFTYPAGCSTIDECIEYCKVSEHFAECQPLVQELDKAVMQIAQTLGMPCTNFNECVVFCKDEQNKDVCTRAMMALYASDPKTMQRMAEMLNIPDTINFAQILPKEAFENLEMLRQGVKNFFFYVNVLVWVTVTIVVLIAIISFNVKSACSKLGWPFATAGILLLGLSFFDPAMIKQIIGAPPTPSGPMAVVEPIIFDAVRALFDVRTQGAALTAAGVILVIFSFLLPKKEEKKEKK